VQLEFGAPVAPQAPVHQIFPQGFTSYHAPVSLENPIGSSLRQTAGASHRGERPSHALGRPTYVHSLRTAHSGFVNVLEGSMNRFFSFYWFSTFLFLFLFFYLFSVSFLFFHFLFFVSFSFSSLFFFFRTCSQFYKMFRISFFISFSFLLFFKKNQKI
jgi:hypothetical protein